MLRKRSGIIIRLIIILGIFLGLAGTSLTEKASAQTVCLWEGTVSSDWFNADNWSGCYFNTFPSYPVSEHDAVIQEVTGHPYPNLSGTTSVSVNSLTIDANAELTTSDLGTVNIYADSVINNGAITVNSPNRLAIRGPFYNNGQVNFAYTYLYLNNSSSHAGSFTGDTLRFNVMGTEQTHSFQPSSIITVDDIYVTQIHTITFNGTVTADSITVETNSSVTEASGSSIDISDIILKGGEYIVDTYTIATGESFTGTGTIQSNLTNSGTVSPGSSPGTITVDGDYTQEATGTLAIELGGTIPGTEHDQLVVTGAATLGGTLEVTLIDDFSPELGDTFTIMTYGSVSGSFASASLPTLDPGLKWGVSLGSTTMRLIVEADGGLISGEVNYTGNHGTEPITVGLFTDPGNAPVHTVNVGSGTSVYPYSIVGIPDGSYYIGVLMDLNGNHQPDPDEPFAWYSLTPGGAPLAVVISGANPDHTDIDIQLDDPIMNFIPLFVH